ncbi:MAG TPA: cupin domain-containing protein [Opitutaceae bacterium]|nr:cupin domain-containing protein [Opitutaceae bacterium]
MDIIRVDERATERGRSDYFTGTVWLDPIVAAKPPSRVRAARVAFEPGARTAWHTHPLGQTLHVLAGVGRVQQDGHPVRTLRPGDTVVILPGERHWHGAAPTHSMVHLAIQEADDLGNAVTWLERVADADYIRAPQD